MRKVINGLVVPLVVSILFGFICGKLVYQVYNDDLENKLSSSKLYLIENGEYLTYDSMREENSGYANSCYRSAIERFGGEVIECNYQDHYEDLLGILSVVDGVLLTGGDDASIMGLFIINYCVRNNKRLLGICLGMQEIAYYFASLGANLVLTYNTNKDLLEKVVSDIGIEVLRFISRLDKP